MKIISYDIADDRLRAKFMKMITRAGAIRLQYSVYEVDNTNRMMENVLVKIDKFSKGFSKDDSVVVFDVSADKMIKYGNAIHRDQAIVYL